MPGIYSEPALKITPDRRTYVVYRKNIPWLVQPIIGHQRDYGELVANDLKGMSGTVIRRNLGIQLALSDTEYGPSTITGDTSAGYIGGDFPTGFLAVQTVRSYPEISGQGSGSSLAATAGPMYKRQQAAGESLSDTGNRFRLDTDQNDFPGPTIDGVAMDRVFKASEAGNNLIGHEYVWKVDASTHTRTGVFPILAGYFPGPNNYWKDVWTGLGSYCLVGFNNGECELYELGDQVTGYEEDGTPIIERRWYRWGQFKANVAGEMAARSSVWTLRIYVSPPWSPKQFIHIRFGGQNDARPRVGGPLSATRPQTNPMLAEVSDGFIFEIQRKGGTPPAPVNDPVRLDVPRAIGSAFSVKAPGWATTGFFRDRKFFFDLPNFGKRIRLNAFGDFPTGTDIVIKLFTSAGIEVALADSGWIGTRRGFYAEFEQGEESTFYPEVHLTGPGTTTPTVTQLLLLRNGSFNNDEDAGFDEIELVPQVKDGAQVSIITGGADPQSDSFAWTHVDLLTELDPIKQNGILPFTIETEFTGYDPETDRRCILGGGICRKKPRKRRNKNTKAGFTATGPEHPYPVQWEYDFTGEPLTWMGTIVKTIRPGFQYEEETGQPRKATDAIKILLNWMAWPMSYMDIPDLPVRLFPVDGAALEIDFNADLIAVAVEIARVYLGATLHFDWNSGDNGKWKLITPSVRAPYTNKTYFTTSIQDEDKLFALGAYADHNYGSYSVPTVPLRGLIIEDVMPAANRIEVIGGVNPESGEVIRQVWKNTRSYKVHPDQVVSPTDKEHPDWVGFEIPLWKRNVAIQSHEQAAWILARLEQQVGHGYKLIHFEAPLHLIVHEDDPDRRRPLRIGDPVTVNDDGDEYQCIVRGVTINYGKDSHQLAVYEIETARDVALP